MVMKSNSIKINVTNCTVGMYITIYGHTSSYQYSVSFPENLVQVYYKDFCIYYEGNSKMPAGCYCTGGSPLNVVLNIWGGTYFLTDEKGNFWANILLQDTDTGNMYQFGIQFTNMELI